MRILRNTFSVSYDFPVIFTRGVFAVENPALAEVLADAGRRRHRVLVVVDSNVLASHAGFYERTCRYFEHNCNVMELVAPPVSIPGGETCKNDHKHVNTLLEIIEKHHMCRQSFVFAVGGGAVLDTTGYAAAIAHRGIRLIRMPTTVLSQNDAGVGVKNGVNAFGKKNFLGTFAPPAAVVSDFDFLKTLPVRDLRSGISEAVKVALIRDRGFFDYLFQQRESLSTFVPEVMEKMITRCAELHLEHITSSGDPFEFGSARPLDFGHWMAHRLEELTHGELKHGEAVAIGIALDSMYAMHVGLLSEFELNRVLTALSGMGFMLYNWAMRLVNVREALETFREHLGGKLHICLPKGIGRKVEVHDIDEGLVKKCLETLAVKYSENRRLEDEETHLPTVGRRPSGQLLS